MYAVTDNYVLTIRYQIYSNVCRYNTKLFIPICMSTFSNKSFDKLIKKFSCGCKSNWLNCFSFVLYVLVCYTTNHIYWVRGGNFSSLFEFKNMCY